MRPNTVSRRLTGLLIISFALTVISFLGARVISDAQARGIRDAAEVISRDTLPGGELLAGVRTELRLVDSSLDAFAERSPSTHDAQDLRRDLDRSRDLIRQSWTEYLSLPVFGGERELIDAIEANKRDLDVSIEKVLQRLDLGDRDGALAEMNARTRPAIARIDEGVHAAGAVNRRIAVEAADTIAELRAESRTWGFALDAICVILASAAAYFVVRVVRVFWALEQARVTELEQFAGRVAHDIRSPLATVGFALDLAKRRPELDSKTQSILDRGTRTLQRVGQLVDGLLVFAIAGRPAVEEPGTSVAEVLGGVVEDMRPLAEEKGITIDDELPDSGVLAACSPGVLVSMTSNLLTNAIKYMGDEPVKRVSVRAREVGGFVQVEVSDTGPGIPPALRARVFDLHVRGPESTIPGLGLGLATVRRLAEAHGGAVGSEPNAEGGSRFWFRLPKWVEEARRATSPVPSSLHSESGAKAV